MKYVKLLWRGFGWLPCREAVVLWQEQTRLNPVAAEVDGNPALNCGAGFHFGPKYI